MSMITASLWVPRGAAAAYPTKYEIDDHEVARISKLAKLQLDDAKGYLDSSSHGQDMEDSESSDTGDNDVKMQQARDDVDDDLKAYDLEHYENDPDARDGETMTMFGNAKSLAYHDSNADDPYITMQPDGNEDDEEREELQILPTDSMIVAAKVEDEVAHLEIYIYEDEADNLYVHHDIMLPAIPLCVEWLDLPVGKDAKTATEDARRNYVAVGTFDPDVEIWDLDTVDSMYPNAILGYGGDDASVDITREASKKKRRKRSKKVNDKYHVDAILSLAANRQHRNLLASASADRTIKLWDLTTAVCAKSYSHHADKVCSIAWHPKETTVLLSGSYDRTVVAADMRASDEKPPRWRVESDVETVIWDPHDSNYFYVTTENGIIHFNDIRNTPPRPELSKPVWTLQAHDESISSFNVNTVIPGFLATGSTDRTVKLWNVQSTGPSLVATRNIDVGKVFTTQFASDPEVAFRLAVAGSKGAMQIWDTSTNAHVREVFASRIAQTDDSMGKEDRVVGVGEDSSDSEEEGGLEPGESKLATEDG